MSPLARRRKLYECAGWLASALGDHWACEAVEALTCGEPTHPLIISILGRHISASSPDVCTRRCMHSSRKILW
jgi:hypothetical protein